MTIFQDSSLRPDLRERAKVNDVPVARLIGFEAAQIGEGRATVTLAAGPQHANPMGTLHGGILCDIADAAMGMSFATTLAPDESFTTIRTEDEFLPAGLAGSAQGGEQAMARAHLRLFYPRFVNGGSCRHRNSGSGPRPRTRS